jgi:hypothetical protein
MCSTLAAALSVVEIRRCQDSPRPLGVANGRIELWLAVPGRLPAEGPLSLGRLRGST